MALPDYPPFALNSLLNKEKFFQFTPASSIDSASPLPVLPSEWLVELEDFCRKEKSDLDKNCFDRHLTLFTTHPLNRRVAPSQSLIEGLQLIYRRLRGDLDCFLGPLSESDRTSIIAKLIEDVHACTDGFENRVKHIVTAFETSADLPQLIYQIRKGLVENVSASLTGEIHAWNQVTKVAATEGLGIKANFDEDHYTGNIPREKIVGALEKEFKEKFSPFNLPILLVDQLRGLLLSRGYTGFEQEGYGVGVAERLAEQIKCYLSKEIAERMNWQDFFIINEEDDFNIVIHDLNWELIRKCFFQTLLQEDYFKQQPSQEDIANLLDCACFSNLFSPDDHLVGIESQCFDANSIVHLKKIKTDFPTFWENLRLGFQTEPELKEKLLLVFKELENAPLNFKTLKKIALFFELDLISLNNGDPEYNLAQKLLQKKILNNNILMLAAFEHPVILNVIAKFLTKNPALIDKEMLQQMFLKRDIKGSNALMLAAYDNATGLKFLLTFITENPNLMDKEVVQKMFLQSDKNGFNALMLAAFNNSDALTCLLTFVTENPNLIDQETLRQMFLQSDKNGWNALMVTCLNNPTGLNFLLKFITENPTLLDKETLQQLFLKKINNVQIILHELSLIFTLIVHDLVNIFMIDLQPLRSAIKINGWDALILAAHFQPDGFNMMLKFASEHSDLFDQETLKLVMAKNTGHGWNFFIIKTLLDKYLEGLHRKAQHITHGTHFLMYKFGYSTQQKEIAALKLKDFLETGLQEPEPVKDLTRLKQSYPALRDGRLGQLFNLCHQVASDEKALAEVSDLMKELREEPVALLR